MINHQEFKIESKPELDFRIGEISPVELLAISSQVDLDNLQKTETLFTFALEHTEVKQGNSWFPVKTKDREVYCPIEFKEDFAALNEVLTYFIKEVIVKTFLKSSE